MRDGRSREPREWAWVVALAMVAAACGAGAARAEDPGVFTSEFQPEDCTWTLKSPANSLFPITPGWTLVLEGEEESDEGSEEVRLEVVALRARERIVFMTPGGRRVSLLARVVEEREEIDGELAEVSRNFFAICGETGDVFYFGETVDNYEDGEVANHSGSWRAGKNGAQPGIIMPGRFLIGSRYFQEQAPGVALDRGENLQMGLTVASEAGAFHGCVKVLDTNGLHPDEEGEEKLYCPGIGIVRDVDVELVEYGFGD